MKTYKNIPERGDFVYQQLVGPCKTTGPTLNETRSFFGLLLSKSMTASIFVWIPSEWQSRR